MGCIVFFIFKLLLQTKPLQSPVALKNNYSLLCFCGSTDLKTELDLAGLKLAPYYASTQAEQSASTCRNVPLK